MSKHDPLSTIRFRGTVHDNAVLLSFRPSLRDHILARHCAFANSRFTIASDIFEMSTALVFGALWILPRGSLMSFAQDTLFVEVLAVVVMTIVAVPDLLFFPFLSEDGFLLVLEAPKSR